MFGFASLGYQRPCPRCPGTLLMISGRLANTNRSGYGKLSAHRRTCCAANTSSASTNIDLQHNFATLSVPGLGISLRFFVAKGAAHAYINVPLLARAAVTVQIFRLE